MIIKRVAVSVNFEAHTHYGVPFPHFTKLAIRTDRIVGLYETTEGITQISYKPSNSTIVHLMINEPFAKIFEDIKEAETE